MKVLRPTRYCSESSKFALETKSQQIDAITHLNSQGYHYAEIYTCPYCGYCHAKRNDDVREIISYKIRRQESIPLGRTSTLSSVHRVAVGDERYIVGYNRRSKEVRMLHDLRQKGLHDQIIEAIVTGASTPMTKISKRITMHEVTLDDTVYVVNYNRKRKAIAIRERRYHLEGGRYVI